MRIEDITRILDQHHIGNSTVNGIVLADHWYTKREGDKTTSHLEVVNLTNYTKEQLYRWLGY